MACFGILAGCASGPHDTDNPDWAQAGMPPPPKRYETDKEWSETVAPPPPAFSESRLLPIEMPPYMSLKFGVDPGTITITPDGIVRYVSVARSLSGSAVNATYEGVRCATAEVKLYARHYAEGEWQLQETPTWVSLYEPRARTSLAIAKAGVCKDASANLSPQQILLDMRGDPNRGTP